MDSMIVSLQDNNASMIVCPQDNVHFTPIKEYISVGKLPENPKEKKPAKQIEKKSTADLNIHGIKQKVYYTSILLVSFLFLFVNRGYQAEYIILSILHYILKSYLVIHFLDRIFILGHYLKLNLLCLILLIILSLIVFQVLCFSLI